VDVTYRWSCALPPGWRQSPFDPTTRTGDAAGDLIRATSANLDRARAFTRTGGSPLVIPCVVTGFQAMELDGKDLDEIEASLAETASSRGVWTGANAVRLDRARARFEYQTRAELASVGRLARVSVGFLGKKGFVRFDFYAKSDEVAAVRDEFDACLASFRFDDGFAYVEPPKDGWKSWTVAVVVIGILGALWVLERVRRAAIARLQEARRRRRPRNVISKSIDRD
jgi:hypothetical protein